MPARAHPAEPPQHPMNRGGPLRGGNPRGNPNLAPRCGARNRAGCPCRAPALRGRLRCRLHGGHATGPRTEEGRARIRAAHTRHGRFAAAARVRERHLRGLVRRMHLLCAAVRLRRWLDPALRAKLEAGEAIALGAPPDPGWRARPWTVQAVREAAEAERAELLPWRMAVAAAREVRRAAGGGRETAATPHEPWRAGDARAANGHRPGAGGSQPAARTHGNARARAAESRNDPMNRGAAAHHAESRAAPGKGSHISRNDPMNREPAPWHTGFKGRLCDSTCLTVRGVIGDTETLAWPSDLLGPLPRPGRTWTDEVVDFLLSPHAAQDA